MNIKKQIANLEKRLERKRGRKQQLKKDLKRMKQRKGELERDIEETLQAQALIQETAKKTQQELEFHLSDITGMGLASIFPEPYELSVDFTPRRGKIEADIKFKKGDKLIDPESEAAGGETDVAALALRFSALSLRKPKLRNCVILDEPLKFLKGRDYPAKGAAMIKEISNKLDLQIITVEHDSTLIESSDNIIEVSQRKGISQIRSNNERI